MGRVTHNWRILITYSGSNFIFKYTNILLVLKNHMTDFLMDENAHLKKLWCAENDYKIIEYKCVFTLF